MLSPWAALLDVVFPSACVACDVVLVGREFFCEECEPLLLEVGPVHCKRCGEPGAFDANLCPRCSRHRPAFARAHAPFEHDGAIARAVHRFKYEDRPELSGTLGRLLAFKAGPFLERAPVHVCPIPVHVARYRKRRYDQAELLAVELCALLPKLVLCDDLLTRARPTERQVGLSDERRIANVSRAFEARRNPPANILLIDDVLTTGATADSAARVLIEAGAKHIEVLTLARARRILL